MDVYKFKHLFTSVKDKLPDTPSDNDSCSYDLSCLAGDNEESLKLCIYSCYYKKDKGWIWREEGRYINVLYWLDLELLSDKLDELHRISTDVIVGREGCTYGDTEYDSQSVVFGYNLAMENILNVLHK